MRGKLIESVTETEPEWSDEERAWALALDAVEKRACPGCGRPGHEVFGEDHVADWEVEFEMCGACFAVSVSREAETKNRPGPAVQALVPMIRRRATEA